MFSIFYSFFEICSEILYHWNPLRSSWNSSMPILCFRMADIFSTFSIYTSRGTIWWIRGPLDVLYSPCFDLGVPENETLNEHHSFKRSAVSAMEPGVPTNFLFLRNSLRIENGTTQRAVQKVRKSITSSFPVERFRTYFTNVLPDSRLLRNVSEGRNAGKIRKLQKEILHLLRVNHKKGLSCWML